VSLENLLKIGQLKRHESDEKEIGKLLTSARRNLADARVNAVSPETRFDAAYKALMQAGIVALLAHGYRPDTARPGHHQTVIQSLRLTTGISASRINVLDTLRRKRNLSDYMGEDIDQSSVDVCVEQAMHLLGDVEDWLLTNRPQWMVSPRK